MKTKLIALIAGVLLALGAIGATVWAQGTHVLGAAQSGIAGAAQSQSDQQAQNGCEAYEQALAHQLGIDVSKLQQAQKDAAKTVVDQALHDGQLTQAQADKLKQKIDAANFEHCPHFDHAAAKGQVERAVLTTAFAAAAHALNMTPQQLKDALKSGQSIADIAKSKNVDLQTVKTAVINAENAQIDQAVKDGKITQAQADQLKTMIQKRGDHFLDRLFKVHKQKTQ